uniref:Membrane bound O-acyltransferase domain containing 4 n=1 Tax=Xenopus tropicalis TaxID=8364 RepID=A0A803JE20_XENTR
MCLHHGRFNTSGGRHKEKRIQLFILYYSVLFMYFRFIYLLFGGIVLSCVSMGPYAVVIFIPALGSIVLFHIISWQSVHWWALALQMVWQTACHLWLLYKEYYLQEEITLRLSIMISALMLLTQKITTLALDIHERKVRIIPVDGGMKNWFFSGSAHNILIFLSYLLFFPALLGGPLCSFVEFHHHVTVAPRCNYLCFKQVAKGFFFALILQMLRSLVSVNLSFQLSLMTCRHLNCVCIMWTTALLFKLTYYFHWLLDESLFCAAGFLTAYHVDGFQVTFCDTDIWTLETTHKISVFTRTWNKSTASWLRRIIFEKCKIGSLLMTFAFSAWWHGLHPGHIFGFLCWALLVKADYRIHKYFNPCQQSWCTRVLYRIFTWLHTQLIVAFLIVAIEMRSIKIIWSLCLSYNCYFPILYCLSLISSIKRK